MPQATDVNTIAPYPWIGWPPMPALARRAGAAGPVHDQPGHRDGPAQPDQGRSARHRRWDSDQRDGRVAGPARRLSAAALSTSRGTRRLARLAGSPRWLPVRMLGEWCCRDQYSPLITKNEPRIVPASFDFWRANLNREASSVGTSIPSESLNPTARFLASSIVYITLIAKPVS